MLWLSHLFTLTASAPTTDCSFGNSSCLSCIKDPACFYCHTSGICQLREGSEACPSNSTVRDLQCVKMLGGDADPNVRYAIGISIAVLAIIVDLTVRFCSKSSAHGEYAHL